MLQGCGHRVHVGPPVGVDLAREDLDHPGRGVEAHRLPDLGGQRLGEEPRAAAEVEHAASLEGLAPRLEDAVAGIVAFSGRLLSPDLLKDEVRVRPPVLLVHGDADDVVPPQSLPQAAEALQDAGWEDVYAHIMKGTAHGIAPDGLQVALAFMRDKLGL